FNDAGDKYYTKYLGTAKRMGLVSGVGENMFAPESLITRQDMTVILYRILNKLGKLPESTESAVFDEFMDKDDIADYAKEGMKTFAESKIISGYDNRLHPFGLTTRAQAAQILYNLLK
ncbi:MAG: S-layer homology domain-containing protein, partial [Tissierellia bacterium]|nr:S-layer homology domain-containing protein [Tissierellia bacterium]